MVNTITDDTGPMVIGASGDCSVMVEDNLNQVLIDDDYVGLVMIACTLGMHSMCT